MKKTLFTGMIISLIGCNNNAGVSAKSTGSNTVTMKESDTNDMKDEDAPPEKIAEVGACGKLILFQSGAEIEATSYDKDGKETSKSYTKILSVKNEDGFTVANVEGKDTESDGEKKTNTVNYNYKCDGNKIYFDVASMFRTAEKEQDASFESSFIEYPINVTEGQTLPDATGKMSSVRDGKKSEMSFIYKNRKVEGKEEVTTPAGTWSCYKISNSISTEMNIPGMDEKKKEMMKEMQKGMKTTTTTWFSPDFGIVKMEMYMNGKLQSWNEVTAVKK
jgi:hypothetical protein